MSQKNSPQRKRVPRQMSERQKAEPQVAAKPGLSPLQWIMMAVLAVTAVAFIAPKVMGAEEPVVDVPPVTEIISEEVIEEPGEQKPAWYHRVSDVFNCATGNCAALLQEEGNTVLEMQAALSSELQKVHEQLEGLNEEADQLLIQQTEVHLALETYLSQRQALSQCVLEAMSDSSASSNEGAE